jgi:hypothetical protein
MGGVSLCHENGVNGLFINEMWASRQRRRATGRLKAGEAVAVVWRA